MWPCHVYYVYHYLVSKIGIFEIKIYCYKKCMLMKWLLSQNLFTSVVERTPKIEKVNVDGGRFIREAKVNIGALNRIIETYLFCGILWYYRKKKKKNPSTLCVQKRVKCGLYRVIFDSVIGDFVIQNTIKYDYVVRWSSYYKEILKDCERHLKRFEIKCPASFLLHSSSRSGIWVFVLVVTVYQLFGTMHEALAMKLTLTNVF